MSRQETMAPDGRPHGDAELTDPSGSERASGDSEAPRLEPWLGVSLLAIVPMIVAFAIPKEFVLHAAAVSGVLFIIGLAMLVMQERNR